MLVSWEQSTAALAATVKDNVMRGTLHTCLLLTLGFMFMGGCSAESERLPDTPTADFTNSIGMEFNLIPAGDFMMGSSKSARELAEAYPGIDPEWFDKEHERPQHLVRITRPFYMGVTEVTQEQFEKVMGTNPSAFSRMGTRAGSVKGIDTSSFPVEQVRWFEAVAFCNQLSERERMPPYYQLVGIARDVEDGRILTARVAELGGPGYRLPSEAEWEYACRADSTTAFSFGESADQLGEFACYGLRLEGHPQRVGSRKPNPWGLYDMHGNVCEWCNDWYGQDYYANARTDNPTGPDYGSERVVRGGSRFNSALCCRSAYRYKFRSAGFRFDLGFRVVLGVAPDK